MKTLEVTIDDGNHIFNEWIPEDELQKVIKDCLDLGASVKIIGEVSWRRQLARMENNPEDL